MNLLKEKTEPRAGVPLAERIGLPEGPARPNARNEEISLDDAKLLKKMIVKTVDDGLASGKTREQIVAQLEALTKGGIKTFDMQRINDYITERGAKETALSTSRLPERTGQARATQGVLAKRAEDARSKFITATLEEIAAHRRAEGRGTIGQDEAIKVASELYDQINELITRVQATPRRENLEEVILLPAQMRAGKVTRGAVTGMADTRPLEQRPFGAYQAAVDNILDNLRSIRDQAINYRPEGRRVEAGLLRKQFPKIGRAHV